MHVDRGDVGRNQQLLGVGSVEQRVELDTQLLAAGAALQALAARGGVDAADPVAGRERRIVPRGDHGAGVLVSEAGRRRSEQHGMAAAIALRIGSAGQSRLDRDHDLAGSGSGLIDTFDADVAGSPEARSDHGQNTTLRTLRSR